MKMKMNSIVIFQCLLIFSSLLLSPSVSDRCNPDDKRVLLSIKKALNHPYVLTSWKPEEDCCTWYCVKCDRATNRINSLTIFSDGLYGQIPAAVGDLPYLETLDLHTLTNFTGTIQPSIAKLKNLKFLRLSRLNLYGSVPDFLSQLDKLTLLDLSFNKLSGRIPASLSKLRNLESIYLERNMLTGSIPESFGRFSGKVPSLYLSHNQLSGKIPVSLGNMDFGTIDFSRNKLEGDASFLFGSKKKKTWIVDISRNMLEFDLSKVKFPKSLASLDMNRNRIYGSIPAGMTSLELQSLDVSYNRLCGEIPKGGKLQSFEYSNYFHNKCLCGAPLDRCRR